MNPALHRDITARLIRDFGFKPEAGYLRKGECPACGKREMYTHAEKPWVLRCGRLDKCGHEEHVKEVYADLFESWSERHPTTPANPNAAAEAYMRDHRGFDLERVRGWFAQDNYYNPELGLGSATVRFALPGIGYWERIIDRPQRFGKRKANFRGSYMGAWWQAPGATFEGVEEIWITEGIFDAIALMHAGVAAVSSLSCNNYPEAALAAMAETRPLGRPRLVFAYDDGKAGEGFTRKHVKRAIEAGWDATAAQPPGARGAKLDWNELWQRDRLSPRDLQEYRYYGALLLAETPGAKANLMYSRHGWNSFSFDHDSRLYWFKLDIEKFGKTRDELAKDHPDFDDEKVRDEALLKSGTVTEICNCLPVPLYFLKNEVTDESWYYFRVDFPHGGPSVKNTFSAGQLAASAEFKKRLLHSGAGAIWTGSAGQLDSLLSKWTYNIKTVETVDFIGYSLKHQAYVFDAVAVQAGRVVGINAEDYFDLGKLAIKSLSKNLRLDINPDLKQCSTEWFDRLWLCYGARGAVALAYWLGSLFAEQVRERFESWPFLEIVGEAGAGKTTLLELLWKLLGRTGYEGFDPMKASNVGFLRSMAQVANLPVVLIESDREEDADGARGRPKNAFHWDSLKSLYNGGSLRATGVKSSSNDTYEPQFRGALVISQNAPVQASTPIMERIVHLWFDKSMQSDAGREAALALGRTSAADVSGFIVKALSKEREVLDLFEQKLRSYEREVQAAGAGNQRIQKNYAQGLVCIDALAMVCPITPSQQAEAKTLLKSQAVERERALAREHPMVEAFWEAYEFLNEADDSAEDAAGRLNHSRTPRQIAINLNHFVQVATERRQQIPPIQDLKRLLKSSRSPRFIDVRVVNSRINEVWNRRVDNPDAKRPASVKCWVFDMDA